MGKKNKCTDRSLLRTTRPATINKCIVSPCVITQWRIQREAQPARTPPPPFRVLEKNEICFRTLHLRPQILFFSRGSMPLA